MTPPLKLQDEVLQVLFWMRGEGLGTEVRDAEIRRFLSADEQDLELALVKLLGKNLLEKTIGHDGQPRYQLTKAGITEGGRRFQDEFREILGHEDHLQCDDPDCDCHEPGWEGVCSHRFAT